MTLPVVVPFHDDEVALDLPSRLAHANGYSSVRRFVEAAGIRTTDLAAGEDVAVERLAEWSGIDTARLSEFASRTEGRSMRWTIGKATFNKESRVGHRYRYCPSCVARDIKAGVGRPGALTYTRAAWMTRAIRTCAVHSQLIVEAPYSKAFGRDFSRYVSENADEICSHANCATAGSARSSLDVYLNDRILGIERNTYLDQFEVYVVINLCAYLGEFVTKYRSALGEFSEAPWNLGDAEVGFFFASQGEAAIRHLMSIVLRSYWLTGARKMPFGPLALWLRRNRDNADCAAFVELFQDISERNLPLGPGELSVFRVRHRYVHTLLSAATEFGMSEERVLQLAETAGLVAHPLPRVNKVLFNAEKLNVILKAATATLTSKQAREKLDVTEEIMSRILKAGMIDLVEQKNDGRKFARIREEDLIKFQTGLFSQARMMSHDDSDSCVTISDASKRCFCTYDEVVSLVRNGSLKYVGALPNHAFRLSHLLVDWNEVMDVVVEKRLATKAAGNEIACDKISASRTIWKNEISHGVPSDLLNNRQAARLLRVAPPTIRYLIENGYVSTSTDWNMKTNRRQSYISLASVEKFAETHISIADLAAQLETHPAVIEKMLSKNGIAPIYEQEGRVARFYQQSELAPLNMFSLRQ
ncbi:TniQ family protein [Rhizobium johnstonii]|uniref:TniQ family protein n=1 Tax=Rhizobium johnstonii TaxID=3019933 RepID=UPI003F9935F1